MKGYLFVMLLSLPWVLLGAGYMSSARRKGYSPGMAAGVLALLSGAMGFAGMAGETALRVWMIYLALAAPVLLWLAVVFIPAGQPPADKPAATLIPWLIGLWLWGGWMALNGVTLTSALMMKGSVHGAILGQLQLVRSWVSLYRDERDGQLPAGLDELVPRYMERLPEVKSIVGDGVILHGPSAEVKTFDSYSPDDRGGWGYVYAAGSPDHGRVFINCTHIGVKGREWASY